jgi:hypothetical protein
MTAHDAHAAAPLAPGLQRGLKAARSMLRAGEALPPRWSAEATPAGTAACARPRANRLSIDLNNRAVVR